MFFQFFLRRCDFGRRSSVGAALESSNERLIRSGPHELLLDGRIKITDKMSCRKFAQHGLAGISGTKHEADFVRSERNGSCHRAENGLGEKQNDKEPAHAPLVAEDTPEERGAAPTANVECRMPNGRRFTGLRGCADFSSCLHPFDPCHPRSNCHGPAAVCADRASKPGRRETLAVARRR